MQGKKKETKYLKMLTHLYSESIVLECGAYLIKSFFRKNLPKIQRDI